MELGPSVYLDRTSAKDIGMDGMLLCTGVFCTVAEIVKLWSRCANFFFWPFVSSEACWATLLTNKYHIVYNMVVKRQ
jgi:hypothetical protein